ncbi:MAG: NUDIX domain-containing protein [Pseudomonadota bacterium]|nr:NUDIX domain-containing protein [Pseudomonadota bacterium]
MRGDVYHHHFGVYALIESPCQSKILLIQQKDGPYQGLLDFPEGVPLPHEILEQTLCRIVTEHTGMDVEHCQQYKTLSSLFQYNSNGEVAVLRHIGVLYRAQTAQPLPQQLEEHCASNLIWVEKSDLLSRDVTPFVSLYLQKK